MQDNFFPIMEKNNWHSVLIKLKYIHQILNFLSNGANYLTDTFC